MAADMATRPQPALRRDASHRVLGGVCAGIGRQLGVDPLIVRVAFIAGAFAGGIGIVLYVAAWALIPLGDAPARTQRLRAGRGTVEVTSGVALLAVSALLTFRELGIWVSDAIVWPVVLVAAGAALLWRQSSATPAALRAPDSTDVRAAPRPAHRRRPARLLEGGLSARTAKLAWHVTLGAGLVIAAGLVFLRATNALSTARDVVLSVLVVAVVLGVIFAPWILRLVRTLTDERTERVRSQERAEMAAHLHDSVLQTLALVQQRSEDPRAVAALARRQERELRAWLSRRAPSADEPPRLASALETAASEVERDHGVTVDVVAVGDADLDERGAALVAAAREAMVNAAKFGGGSAVDVYAEALDGDLQVFVRDRGPGFRPADVPADRRGVRESIVGRMARHGGRAEIHSAPDAGTEVELTMPRSEA